MTNAEARFNKIHIRKVYACLAVTWHLHFWQNDRDFLRATVVTRGWNGYRNKSQHRKSTLEKKILPPFQQGFEPATFQSRVWRSNHWAIPAPPFFQQKVAPVPFISKQWTKCFISLIMSDLTLLSVAFNEYNPGDFSPANASPDTYKPCWLDIFTLSYVWIVPETTKRKNV